MSAVFQQMRQDSPSGLWFLDEKSGTTAVDLSGNGHHGTYAAGYTLDQAGIGGGRAVALTGEAAGTGLITFPNAVGAPLAAANGSIEWWFYPTGTPNGWSILGMTESSGWSNPMQFMWQGATTIRCVVGSGANSETANIPSLVASQNKWNHIVLTWAGTSYVLYVNTVGEGFTNSQGKAKHASNLLRLGVRQDGNQRGTTGRYANLAIYATTLSAERIRAHYLAGVRGAVSY